MITPDDELELRSETEPAVNGYTRALDLRQEPVSTAHELHTGRTTIGRHIETLAAGVRRALRERGPA